jgi:N-acetyl-1-D-myo-inositol-2-amino-2-deoxy-alpha-D-glucopyranoside deacetylase
VRIVREVRPQVLVSYDDFGGYGHPDHIRAHEVTVRAFTDAADGSFAPDAGPAWRVSKLYETALPKSFIQAGIEHFRGSDPEDSPFGAAKSADEVRVWVPDEKITTQVEAPEFFETKIAAMRAHRTQMAVDGVFFALADGLGRPALTTEYFVLARGVRGPGSGPYDRETDLFAGLNL